MSNVLITGASGFIGRELAKSMGERHNVLCLSRSNPRLALPWFRGDFAAFEDLRQLDKHEIDTVVHLAAVTGGCLEREGMLVNVEGTRVLMRYAIDRGCRKFVMASSIALVGFQSTQFRPVQVPIPDEHPCLDRDGYGFTKHLLEEVTKYLHRQNPQIDVINMRLSTVFPDDGLPPPKKEPGKGGPWALGGITIMARSDAVRAFAMAAESPHKPGVRTMNATAPKAWVAAPVAEFLQEWWGDDVDLTHFKLPGHAYDSVYNVSRIASEIGFVAKITSETC